MAKLRNAKVKSSSGGYKRLFNDEELGSFISKLQSTVISNGSELETMIVAKSFGIENLDVFLSNKKTTDGVYLCTKRTIKKSSYKLDKHEPDLIVFEYDKGNHNCYIIELKDGDSFDTKKSQGELASLKKYREHLGAMIPFITRYYICCFNQENHNIIVKGFKNAFKESETMTGTELCKLLRIDYESIIETRKKDAEDNLSYFAEEIIKIPSFMKNFRESMRLHIKECEFYPENFDGDYE